MKLTVLGSGVAISGAERAAAGFVLELNGYPIVVDLGFGCFKNMQKAGIDYLKVNDLLFTHFEHVDHINDLLAFLQARKVSVDQGISKPIQINIFGGPGFKKFFDNLSTTFAGEQPPELKVVELDSFSTKKFNRFSLTTKPMKHVPSSIGFRFNAGNKVVVFSGDTGFNENLVDLAKGADLLVTECSFATTKSEGHLTAEEVATIAARANAKALLLTHFYAEAEKADVKALTKKKFKGRVYAAKDLMQVNV